MQYLSSTSLEIFLNVMEETPHEKHFLTGDSKPSSGMVLGLFGLTMASYGHKHTERKNDSSLDQRRVL